MKLVGWESTNAGGTQVALSLDGDRATIQLHARWMGQAEVELCLDCTHRVLGSASGLLVLISALAGDRAVPLPPSDGPVWFEYVEVPPQPAEIGSEMMAIASGEVPATFTHLLWLHRYSYFDDGTELDPSE